MIELRGLADRLVARRLGGMLCVPRCLQVVALGRQDQEVVGQQDDDWQEDQEDPAVAIAQGHWPPPSRAGTGSGTVGADSAWNVSVADQATGHALAAAAAPVACLVEVVKLT